MSIRILSGLNVDNNVLFVNDSTNRVGIGTATPDRTLSVHSAASSVMADFKYTAGGFSSIILSNTLGSAHLASVVNDLLISPAGTERMRITSAGNVGIGTTSPAYRLDISSTEWTQSRLSATGSGYAPASLLLESTQSGARGQGVFMHNTSVTKTFFAGVPYLSDSNRYIISYAEQAAFGSDVAQDTYALLTVTNAGRVGIGTTSPSAKLVVSDDSTTVASSITNSNSGGSGLQITAASGTNNILQLRNYLGGEVMRVRGDGNVGIGTTSPIYKLQVAGSAYVNGGALFIDSGNFLMWGNSAQGIRGVNDTSLEFVSGSSERMRITSGGSVLVNTSSEQYASTGRGVLEINGDTGATKGSLLGLKVNNTHGGYILVDSTQMQVYNHLATPLKFFTNANERMRIDATGNVGIGTTSPSYKLDVAGTIAIRNSSYYSGTYNWSLSQDASNGRLAIAYYGSEKVSIKDDGNVGIGTTSPAAKLDVNGSLNVAANLYNSIGGNKAFGGNGSTFLYLYTGTTALAILNNADTSELVRITNAGNVGIGTTSPAVKLQVDNNSHNYIQVNSSVANVQTAINVTNSSSTSRATLSWEDGTRGAYADLYSSTYLSITTQSSEKMRITAAGNVGIGVTSTSAKLESYQSAAWTGSNYAIRANHYSTFNGIRINGQDQERDIYQENTSYGIGIATSGAQPIKFLISDSSEIMRVAANGNVGIGTTSPSVKLHTVGDGLFYSNTNTNLTINSNGGVATLTLTNGAGSQVIYGGVGGSNNMDFYTGSTFRMRIDPSGNVGIGTTATKQKLIVEGTLATKPSGVDGYYSYLRSNWAENNAFELGISEDGASNFHKLITSSNYYFGSTLQFWTSDTEKMRITDTGNVGIGTTSPSTTLDVLGKIKLGIDGTYGGSDYVTIGFGGTSNGYNRVFGYNGTSDGLYLTSATGHGISFRTNGGSTDNMLINSAGNVGIGTTSPSQALHVSGSARVTGAYYDSSNSAGSSGQVLSSTGSGTAWVNQGEATATSLFDLLPAARVTYDWTVQLTAGTWADIFSSNTVLSNGTWMVQAYVSDYAVGGQQYQETYSGVMSWGNANSTNESGPEAISEIVLHRSGHAANSGNFYLRTVERGASTLLFQGMSNLSHTAATTINFKFVKIF